jgi:hypothetical protein
MDGGPSSSVTILDRKMGLMMVQGTDEISPLNHNGHTFSCCHRTK